MALWNSPQGCKNERLFLSEMIRASRNWGKTQNDWDYLGRRKIKQWEESCHSGIKCKQKENPVSLYHSLSDETAAIKAKTRSRYFSGLSTRTSRELGSNGLCRFPVYIINLHKSDLFLNLPTSQGWEIKTQRVLCTGTQPVKSREGFSLMRGVRGKTSGASGLHRIGLAVKIKSKTISLAFFFF